MESFQPRRELIELGERVAKVFTSNKTLAVAESLTGGQLAAACAAAPDASEWFRGGVVAYQPRVKHGLLRTPEGPVVTAETALAMAASAARLFEAEFAIGVTGVGGPGSEEGEPAGTVHIAVCRGKEKAALEQYRFAGDPLEVMHRTIEAALHMAIQCAVGGEAT